MRRRLLLLLVLLSFASTLAAQRVPTPSEHFGFEIGADRQLADWDQLTAYYEALARSSGRVTVDTLGRTTLDRPFVMLTITSPENHARLEELRRINQTLADPRRVSGEQEVERLIEQGRTVVLITHGIHSTEVGSAQTAARLAHRLASAEDEQVRQILENVVLLHIPSLNPDGTQMVAEWYRQHLGGQFEGAPLPRLYHHYIGHDNNRDWYAFTQRETQLTITGAHNRWRPHIVHDIHQMGATGARYFIPPYIDPIEPNVEPRLVTALNQLGMYMAAEMAAEGKQGVVVNAIFDAFTPARAYQHYHGGVRILSETASARMATPVTIPPDQLEEGRGYHAGRPSWNFPDPWPGGEWRLADIVDYMESGALALLTNAARNRPFWLRNFYETNRRATERWPEWPHAWVIPAGQANQKGLDAVLRILRMADVEVHRAEAAFTAVGRQFPRGSYVVPMNQPFASFAQTMLERQEYPDLREYPGGPPQRPYDVTAHTLPLLMNVEAVAVNEPVNVGLSAPIPVPEMRYTAPRGLAGRGAPRIAVYRSWTAPMPEGWTRWVLDQHGIAYDSLQDADIRRGDLARRYDVILMQDQPARQIVEGWPQNVMPEPYAGGLGEEGVEAIRQFVQNGGRLVAIERATDFAIESFRLGVRNAVADLRPQEFYIPGSILALQLEQGHPLGQGMARESIAWYWGSSRAFEVTDPAVRVAARYRAENPLLSGWVLGEEQVAGKPAIVEARVGRGSVVLFGFQPNYRGQTIATWPLLFNALARAR
ncbi:MAG: hypothetical protein H0W11_13400 [Gemmatimonadetes bacterium]|nr:hypothetical protein [Gemmatimonadota bacterium]